MELTTHLHKAPKIRKCGCRPHAFIAWCLTEHKETFTFAFFFFCGATGQIRSRPPCTQASRSQTSRPHTIRHTHTHTRQGSSERVTNPSQRPLLTQHTTNTRGEHPCSQLESNPRSQRSSSCRPTP